MARSNATYTFLFTDIEGSTRAWDASPGAMATALERQVNIVDVSSRIGLNLFSRATPGAYARFDNFEVWRLDTPLLALSWNNSGD